MNLQERRARLAKGILLIEEVLADVLREAGGGPLARNEILQRSGLPADIPPHDWHACAYFLELMARDGLIVNDNPNQGRDQWRLVSG